MEDREYIVNEGEDFEDPTPFVYTNLRLFMTTLGIGAIVGFVSWGLALLLNVTIFKLLFCHDLESIQCVSSLTYASVSSILIATGIGVVLLVRMDVFRPLLIGLCVLIGLWGLGSSVTFLVWWAAALSFIFLFALAYSAIAWLARIRSFGMAIVLIVVLIVILRLALNS